MAEYFEKEALVERITRAAAMIGFDTPAVAIDRIILCIKHTPAADVAPVVHGQWVYDEHEMEWACSVCLREAPVGMTTYYTTNYCPHCGAKMDGDTDG